MIDGLNELRRQVPSGVEETADESMSAIRFCTTPKGYLPRYSYIIRKLDPLGKEMKKVERLRLRLAIATKGCSQLTSNDTYFADSWFISVKKSDEIAAAGVDYCGPVKTSHKGFCLSTLEKVMKYWPRGSYLVLKSTPIFTVERPLLVIGHKYNSRKVLGFIVTEGAGRTEPGNLYLSRFPDIYSNVYVCPIVCPHSLVRYFNACNEIENHNRMR